MRQETGSKVIKSKKTISIRITSSGDNFSRHTPIPEGEVIIVCETQKAMLLPTHLLEQSSLDGHLLSAGIAVDSNYEEIELINHSQSLTALVVVPASLLHNIESTYGSRATLTTPLLAAAPARGHDLLVHLSEEKSLLTLTLYNGGDLLFAEIFEIGGINDALYWITRLGGGYDLSKYTIHIDGGGKDVETLLGRYYKDVKLCE